MRSLVGLDMDGVVADFVNGALNIVNEIWNLNLKYEDMKRPRLGRIVSNLLKDKGITIRPEEVYSEISQCGYFEDLELIDGAYPAVNEIAKNNDIIFISKAMEWERCPGEKRRWLDNHFGDLNFSFAMVDRFETKGLFNLDFIVDDDPRTLHAINMAVPIAVEQPWNAGFLKHNENIISVNSIKEVPHVIEHLKQNSFCF